MKKEIWKDIAGFEGYYKVSNYARVLSVKRVSIRSNGVPITTKERILKPQIRSHGYYCVCMLKKGVSKGFTVHRLKAIAFVPNPLNKPQVNHRDGNKLNNGYHTDGDDNLEWNTHAENLQHALDFKLRRPPMLGKSGSKHNRSKPVVQLSRHGDYINEFASMTEASNKTGINLKGISANCRGKNKTSGGFVWQIIELKGDSFRS